MWHQKEGGDPESRTAPLSGPEETVTGDPGVAHGTRSGGSAHVAWTGVGLGLGVEGRAGQAEGTGPPCVTG